MLGERCQVDVKLDDKGRLALPARLRKRLKDEGIGALVLTYYDGAIRGFTPQYFEERIESRIGDMDPLAPGAQELHHAILAVAVDCNVDSQGRMRIPTHLRREAGLDREIVLHTVLHWVEIWDRERWLARRVEVLKNRATRQQYQPPRLTVLPNS